MGRGKVLIIDDEPDIVETLTFMLEARNYDVIAALDGAEGIVKVKTENPDVALLDIMMPGMDGYAVCNKLKSNDDTKNLPVIMLTAKGEGEAVIKAHKSGADDYIVKPFSSHELLTRLKNIIHQRKQLHDRIQHELLLEPEKNEVISIDNIFIKNARKIVENNLSDYEFTVEKFADEIALSRFHLNRKLQNLTGLTPSRFIREIRLKKAVHLLENHKDNISQIALEVGFDNFAYFNRCFKDKYGSSPSRYISSLKNR